MDSIARGFDDLSMVGCDGFFQYRIVFRQRSFHRFG
jgi:hypothetical protein